MSVVGEREPGGEEVNSDTIALKCGVGGGGHTVVKMYMHLPVPGGP